MQHLSHQQPSIQQWPELSVSLRGSVCLDRLDDSGRYEPIQTLSKPGDTDLI